MFLTQKRILLAKVETTYGTDSTPVVASDAIDAEKIDIMYEGDVLERNPVRATLSPSQPVLGARSIKISFDVEIKGSGSAGTASKLGDLIQACGFAETVSAGSSVLYLPTGVAEKSITVYLYDLQDSGSPILHKIKGARGTFQLNAEAGKVAKLSFTFYGLYTIPADVADPGTPTYQSTKPPIVESAQLTLNGVTTLVAQALSLDMQNGVIRSDDISSVGGVSKYVITSRKPTGKIAPEAVSVAAYDYWSDWIAATARALSLVIGSAAGNKCTISMPKITPDAINQEDASGMLRRSIPYRASANAGNDEVSINFQ